MTDLTDEDRNLLAEAIHANDCGCFDWHADDQEDVTYREHASAVAPVVEQIIARHVAAALNEAADEIEAWRGVSERYADDSTNDAVDRSKALQRRNAYDRAARIVRTHADP